MIVSGSSVSLAGVLLALLVACSSAGWSSEQRDRFSGFCQGQLSLNQNGCACLQREIEDAGYSADDYDDNEVSESEMADFLATCKGKQNG